MPEYGERYEGEAWVPEEVVAIVAPGMAELYWARLSPQGQQPVRMGVFLKQRNVKLAEMVLTNDQWSALRGVDLFTGGVGIAVNGYVDRDGLVTLLVFGVVPHGRVPARVVEQLPRHPLMLDDAAEFGRMAGPFQPIYLGSWSAARKRPEMDNLQWEVVALLRDVMTGAVR
jgi:hypothetical protein